MRAWPYADENLYYFSDIDTVSAFHPSDYDSDEADENLAGDIFEEACEDPGGDSNEESDEDLGDYFI